MSTSGRLASLEREMSEEQESLRRIVFGSPGVAPRAAPDLPTRSHLLQTGAQWSGRVGRMPFLMVVCHRDGRFVEAVGIWPGESAGRIEGLIDEVRRRSTRPIPSGARPRRPGPAPVAVGDGGDHQAAGGRGARRPLAAPYALDRGQGDQLQL